tara:strand:- start:140 stop:607 length:468 start_codon:yes stop_codon:yes gene_type:complete
MVEITWQAIYILLQIMFAWDQSFPASTFYIDDHRNIYCLSVNAYHEARGESLQEQMAVSQVVLNRVADPRWPSDTCEVITQANQFSWYDDALSNSVYDMQAWKDNVHSVLLVYSGMSDDIVDGATHYYAHNKIDKPTWAEDMSVTVKLRGHTYLK